MTAFRFDAEAALKRAREGRPLPNLPNRPNRGDADGAGLGGLGRLGPERDLPHVCDPRVPPEPSPPGPDLNLARELFEERAAIREHDGGQDRAQSEAATCFPGLCQ